MIKKNLVQAHLKQVKMTQSELAKEMGINPATLSVKLNDEKGERMTVNEATKIAHILKIDRSQLTDIFFAEELA